MKNEPFTGKKEKAIVVATGEKVKVTLLAYGVYQNVKTGDHYYIDEIKVIPRRHMWQIGFTIWRVGFFIFAREYFKYNIWYLIPGIPVSAVNGYDRYVDAEIKFLCFGLGIRFIWVKKK